MSGQTEAHEEDGRSTIKFAIVCPECADSLCPGDPRLFLLPPPLPSV